MMLIRTELDILSANFPGFISCCGYDRERDVEICKIALWKHDSMSFHRDLEFPMLRLDEHVSISRPECACAKVIFTDSDPLLILNHHREIVLNYVSIVINSWQFEYENRQKHVDIDLQLEAWYAIWTFVEVNSSIRTQL
jgi:hypothetical protein